MLCKYKNTLIYGHTTAADKAYFWTPFTQLAVTPEFGSSLMFPKILGQGMANKMLLFNYKMSATEAKQHGMVFDIIPGTAYYATTAKISIIHARRFQLLTSKIPFLDSDLFKAHLHQIQQLNQDRTFYSTFTTRLHPRWHSPLLERASNTTSR
jgi:enoyl-CoA hydratase/carnithine racemase